MSQIFRDRIGRRRSRSDAVYYPLERNLVDLWSTYAQVGVTAAVPGSKDEGSSDAHEACCICLNFSGGGRW